MPETTDPAREQMMQLPYLLALLALPLLELGVLIKAGQLIGFWPTLAIVVGTGLLGMAVMVNQGLLAPRKIQEAMAKGEPPLASMFEGALVWIAGFLLITPGLILDIIGLLLLLRPVRRHAARWIGRQLFGEADINVEVRTHRSGAPGQDRSAADGQSGRDEDGGQGPVIEGEFERLGERTIDPMRSRPGDPRHQ